MNELALVKELILKLEWLDIALNGANGQPGLIEKVNSLTSEEGPHGGPGIVFQLEKVLQEAKNVIVQGEELKKCLSDPVHPEALATLRRNVNEAVKEGTSILTENAEEFQRLTSRISEHMVSSAAKAEMTSRATLEDLERARSDLERTTQFVAEELRIMIQEVKTSFSPEKLTNAYVTAASQAITESAASFNSQQYLVLHQEALKEINDKIKKDFFQYHEGLKDELVEIQQEGAEKVKRILSGRAPSLAVTELYDQLARVEAENESLKKRLSNDIETQKEPSHSTYLNSKALLSVVFAGFISSSALTGAIVWLMLRGA